MLALIVTLAIQAQVAMATLTPPVFAAVAAPEIGVDASRVGLFTAALYAAACVSALASGGLLGRFGPMRLSQISLLLCAAGLTLTVTASPLPILLGALVLGAGYGPVTPASSHILIRQTPPERRAFIFSVKQTGVPLGGALAGFLVPALTVAFGWKIAALAVAAVGIALIGAVQPMRRRFDFEEAPAAPSPGGGRLAGLVGVLRIVLGDPALRPLVLSSVTFSMTQLCFGAFVVAYLTHVVGTGLVEAGIVLAAAQVAGVAARIVWGWIADRWLAPRRFLGLLGLAMALFNGLVASFTGGWPLGLMMLVAACHGATAIGWNGLFLAEVARLAPPGAAGAVTGGALFMTFLGIVIGPSLFSLTVNATGSYRLAFAAISAVALAGGVTCLRGGRRR
jgi:MFS family permease